MRVAIIGAGAAGMTAALALRRPDLLAMTPFTPTGSTTPDVVVFEKEQPLAKVRASGNGRCNFTNAHLSPAHYTGDHAAFVAPLLSRFGFREMLAWFQLLGMDAVTLESGMTYPRTLRAQTVADLLEARVRDAGATLRGDAVTDLAKREGRFALTLASGDTSSFDAVLLTTGGSFGVKRDDWSNGYSLAKALGHSLTPLHPGIVALRVAEKARCEALQGVKVEACVSGAGETTTDDVLFTDYGLSGTGIFRLSNALLDAKRPTLVLDVLPQWEEHALVETLVALSARFPCAAPASLLSGYVFAPVAQVAAGEAGITTSDRVSLQTLVRRLKSWPFTVVGTRRRDHGQVTCGGVKTEEVHPETLESRQCPGLYLAGEILDVQGECGGYNLHWAFTSALASARAILSPASSGGREASACV